MFSPSAEIRARVTTYSKRRIAISCDLLNITDDNRILRVQKYAYLHVNLYFGLENVFIV